ncbi:hypothetical protein K3495_g16091, partial [Podosphaera aphanis]
APSALSPVSPAIRVFPLLPRPTHRRITLIVREKGWFKDKAPPNVRSQMSHVATATKVMAANFPRLVNSIEGENDCQVFAITMEDLNEALAIQTHDSPEEIREKLPQEIKRWFRLFVEDKDSTLPPPSKIRHENKPRKGRKR